MHEKELQEAALRAALSEKLMAEGIDVTDFFILRQANMYVYDGVRDERISDHTLQVVAALRNIG